jgi:hypothetical protein
MRSSSVMSRGASALAGSAFHGGAEGMIAQDLTAKVIHRDNAHGRLLSCVGSYSAASSFIHPRLK